MNWSKPHYVFSFVWGIGGTLCYFLKTSYSVPFSPQIFTLISFNVFSFFAIYHLLKNFFPDSQKDTKQLIPKQEIDILYKFSLVLLIIWAIGYCFNIFYSDGLPLIWRVTGSPRTYTDFGIPTFSGLMKSINFFCLVSFFTHFLFTKKITSLLLVIVLITSSIFEMSRGTLLISVLMLAGTYFFFYRINIRIFSVLLSVTALLLLLFGLIGITRNDDSSLQNMILPDSIFKQLPLPFFLFFTYWTSPINNLNYGISFLQPLYKPYFSLITLVPTIVRDKIFNTNVTPFPLKTGALNATTFYSPLISDFGIYFTALIVVYLQFIIVYLFLRGKSGSLCSSISYIALFSCLALSIFYIYFLSLTILFYLFLVFLFMLTLNHVKQRGNTV